MASVKYLNFSGPRLPDISNEEAKPDPRHLCDPNFRLSCAQDNTFLRPCHHGDGKVTGTGSSLILHRALEATTCEYKTHAECSSRVQRLVSHPLTCSVEAWLPRDPPAMAPFPRLLCAYSDSFLFFADTGSEKLLPSVHTAQ